MPDRSHSAYRQPWGGCHEWTGVLRNGYARARIGGRKGRKVSVHVATWEAYYGPVPAGFVVCHKCDNRCCYLIEHLFIGTQSDNVADRDAKGRQARGELIWTAKLTEDQVRAIRLRVVQGRYGNTQALADEFGVNIRTIRDVAQRSNWRHVA